MKFEDRIQQTAKRMAAEQNAHLHVPANPLKNDKTYWGWIATPAAAVIGIVFGLSLQHSTEETTSPVLAQAVDTVFVPKVHHDTLWQTRVEEKERVVEKVIWRDREPSVAQTSSQPTQAIQDDNVCTSVSCDGINYGILASN